jgi:hypothetical protein
MLCGCCCRCCTLLLEEPAGGADDREAGSSGGGWVGGGGGRGGCLAASCPACTRLAIAATRLVVRNQPAWAPPLPEQQAPPCWQHQRTWPSSSHPAAGSPPRSRTPRTSCCRGAARTTWRRSGCAWRPCRPCSCSPAAEVGQHCWQRRRPPAAHLPLPLPPPAAAAARVPSRLCSSGWRRRCWPTSAGLARGSARTRRHCSRLRGAAAARRLSLLVGGGGGCRGAGSPAALRAPGQGTEGNLRSRAGCAMERRSGGRGSRRNDAHSQPWKHYPGCYSNLQVAWPLDARKRLPAVATLDDHNCRHPTRFVLAAAQASSWRRAQGGRGP